jgi:NAD(P)-dependent dehydrogenase (short-subunit alcohol dehydrogenase family)
LVQGTRVAYCATKFGLLDLLKSAGIELHAFPVKVISVLPGGIKTKLAKNARLLKTTSCAERTAKLEKTACENFKDKLRTEAASQ